MLGPAPGSASSRERHRAKATGGWRRAGMARLEAGHRPAAERLVTCAPRGPRGNGPWRCPQRQRMPGAWSPPRAVCGWAALDTNVGSGSGVPRGCCLPSLSHRSLILSASHWGGQTRAASWLPDHRQPWRPVVLPPLWPHTEGPAHLSWSLGTTKPRQSRDRSRRSRMVCRDGVGPALPRQLCEPLPCIQLSHRRQEASLKKWNHWRSERKET